MPETGEGPRSPITPRRKILAGIAGAAALSYLRGDTPRAKPQEQRHAQEPHRPQESIPVQEQKHKENVDVAAVRDTLDAAGQQIFILSKALLPTGLPNGERAVKLKNGITIEHIPNIDNPQSGQSDKEETEELRITKTTVNAENTTNVVSLTVKYYPADGNKINQVEVAKTTYAGRDEDLDAVITKPPVRYDAQRAYIDSELLGVEAGILETEREVWDKAGRTVSQQVDQRNTAQGEFITQQDLQNFQSRLLAEVNNAKK